jgi:hypothetical protein
LAEDKVGADDNCLSSPRLDWSSEAGVSEEETELLARIARIPLQMRNIYFLSR